ncbi:transcription initiation factor TFIID subunit 4 [Cyclospora cayetanensis]|uniref:Transcription initiation factor TFIID subunit 4 n=1 Tax=Cyclospora cayetanensis TaxID=88456 RepID=A0A6P6RYH2_9EIME|nr:transcription initiation factor TFIID subunit 4 [Cyclospora cayetanensis]
MKVSGGSVSFLPSQESTAAAAAAQESRSASSAASGEASVDLSAPSAAALSPSLSLPFAARRVDASLEGESVSLGSPLLPIGQAAAASATLRTPSPLAGNAASQTLQGGYLGLPSLPEPLLHPPPLRGETASALPPPSPPTTSALLPFVHASASQQHLLDGYGDSRSTLFVGDRVPEATAFLPSGASSEASVFQAGAPPPPQERETSTGGPPTSPGGPLPTNTTGGFAVPDPLTATQTRARGRKSNKANGDVLSAVCRSRRGGRSRGKNVYPGKTRWQVAAERAAAAAAAAEKAAAEGIFLGGVSGAAANSLSNSAEGGPLGGAPPGEELRLARGDIKRFATLTLIPGQPRKWRKALLQQGGGVLRRTARSARLVASQIRETARQLGQQQQQQAPLLPLATPAVSAGAVSAGAVGMTTVGVLPAAGVAAALSGEIPAAPTASSAALSCEASASSLGGNFRPVERGAVSSPDSLSAAETVAAMRAVVPSAGRIPVEGSSAVSPPDTFL